MSEPDGEPISLQQALDEFLAGMTGQAPGMSLEDGMSLEELAAWSERAAAAEAADLAARGIVPVSVVHGDLETAEDERLIHDLHQLAAGTGPYCTVIGGHDYTTFHFCGPHAGRDALAYIAAVDRIAKPWWNVTQTAHPVYP